MDLEKVQQQAARFVCNNCTGQIPCTLQPLWYVDQHNWQNLEHCRDTSLLCLLFKILHHQVYVPTHDIPAPTPITATRSTHERNLLVPYARTDVCKYSFFPQVISLWNKLPEIIKETQSLDTFNSRI